MTRMITDAALDELIRAVDPLTDGVPSDAETEMAFRGLVANARESTRGGAARRIRVPAARTVISDVGLWLEVAREQRAELVSARGPAVKRRQRVWRRLLAGTTLGLAGAGTTLALILSATTSPPAFAVTRTPDGAVIVMVNEIAGISGANAQLAALGVRARAVPVLAGCRATVPAGDLVGRQWSAGPASVLMSVEINPSTIPAGETLVLAAKQGVPSHLTLVAEETVRGPAPLCVGDRDPSGGPPFPPSAGLPLSPGHAPNRGSAQSRIRAAAAGVPPSPMLPAVKCLRAQGINVPDPVPGARSATPVQVLQRLPRARRESVGIACKAQLSQAFRRQTAPTP